MLRASAHDSAGRRTIICGLEPGNIDRLRDGKPIFFDAAALGVDCNVCIFLGESPEDMARQLGAKIIDIQPEGSA